MDNCVDTTAHLLSVLKVRFTKGFLKDRILTHPEYPSLLTLVDTLKEYKINSAAFNLKGHNLSDLPVPFVAQIKDPEGQIFVLVKQLTDSGVVYYNKNNKHVRVSPEEFKEKWTGYCLLAETSPNSSEPKGKERSALKILSGTLLIGVGLMILIGLFSLNTNLIPIRSNDSIFWAVYFFFKVIGLVTGIALLYFEVDQFNPVIQTFCSGRSKNMNCNAVLNSKRAHFFYGHISLSLLAFSYFLSTLTGLIFINFEKGTLGILSILSLCALPIVLFSLYFQAFIIRQWCKFCILIQLVLFGEVVTSFLGDGYNITPNFSALPIMAAIFMISVYLWLRMKPLIHKGRELRLSTRRLNKFKNDPVIFKSLLNLSKRLNVIPTGMGLHFKTESAKCNIIKVCNPYCQPCSKAFPTLKDLASEGKINLQIIFTSDGKDIIEAIPISQFLAVHEEGNSTQTFEILDEWYNSEYDYKRFVSKQKNINVEKQYSKMEQMHQWCKDEKITYTPAIFVDGYEMPKDYDIEDLKSIL